MENWKFAMKSILSHKLRSFLTMLGIIIGVAAVVVIMALGNGMRKSVTDSFTGDKKEIQLYFEMADEGEGFSAANLSEPLVKASWLEEIVQDIEGIDAYYVTNSSAADVTFGKRKSQNQAITGVSKDYFHIKDYDIVAGRALVNADYENFSRVILIDTILADELFGQGAYQEALNQVVGVGSKEYRVVGVYKTDGGQITSSGLMGGAVMANTQVASEFGAQAIGQIYFHVKEASQRQLLGQEAAALLTTLSGAKNGSYTAPDFSEMMMEINKVYGTMTTAIGSIAGISLLVGGIGVMNIMMVSVTERTREIGLRKALGATRQKILSQFLIEAVVLTVIGGVIGMILAYPLVGVAGNLMSLTASVSLDVAGIAVAFSALIGIIFGLLPANSASKLDPIEALRYE